MDLTHNLSLFDIFGKYEKDISFNDPFKIHYITTNDKNIEDKVKFTISREIYLLFCDFIGAYEKYYKKNVTMDLILEFFYTLDKFNIDTNENDFLDNLSLKILQFFNFDQASINLKFSNVKNNIIRFFVNIYLFFNNLTQGNFDYFSYDLEEELTSELYKIKYLTKLNEYIGLKTSYGFPIVFKKDELNRNIFEVVTDGSCRNIYFCKLVTDKNPFNNSPVTYYQPFFIQLIGEIHHYVPNAINNLDNYLLLNFNSANIFYDPIVYKSETFDIENKEQINQVYIQQSTKNTALFTYVECTNKYGQPYVVNDKICKRNIYYQPNDFRLYIKRTSTKLNYLRSTMFQNIEFYPNLGDIINFISIYQEAIDFNSLFFLMMGHKENNVFLNQVMSQVQLTNTDFFYNDLLATAQNTINKPLQSGYFNIMRKYIFLNDFKENMKKTFYNTRYIYSLNDTFLSDMITSNRNNYFKLSDFLNLINLPDNQCKSRRYWSIIRDYMLYKIDRTHEIGLTLN